jgi:hypothetical protein
MADVVHGVSRGMYREAESQGWVVPLLWQALRGCRLRRNGLPSVTLHQDTTSLS